MEIAILLHLYQPITQSEDVFRKIYKESYGPLLRKIGKLKDFKISLDIPLSLLEQMDRYGYSDWISDVKELVRLGKVELVGSAAYHPILPKLSESLIEQQIILNEYGLGYYLGAHQSLEGESAIMLKNVVGFFPPELAVDEEVVAVLDSLRYKWLIADETAIPGETGFGIQKGKKYGIYRHKDYEAKLVVRNRAFSNMLSFKRDRDMSDIEHALRFAKTVGSNDDSSSGEEGRSFAIVLDGEFFGHHYDKGFFVLDGLVSLARKMNVNIVTISDYVENNVSEILSEVRPSSWGATDEEMASGNVYPMWDVPDNEIHELQWEILESLIALYNRDGAISGFEEYSVLPFWDSEGIKRIKNVVLKGKIAREILTQKSLNSDQFWWASKKNLPTGDYLYSPEMIKSGLQIFEHLIGMYNNPSVEDAIKAKISAIHELLDEE
ncbi:MAG: hypothetical protein R6T90_05485 [Dissulfuribacterales bacterium]